ncbi:hypothetical protein Nos7524_0950 [Nostoc sp. PCC 7524]|uniref:ATP-binding protein n=1 Tax=Nostoc sp. (strain ATCC 29411 / PCC 7524) TaxID=28072 RepID=UPI00029F0758|nr:ATP-binding protein [Nostoc sp. PCC 7524]AFY46849.1 hypothetical protein Nos7524_0950 [Nostoc sp. PCC 7524]
MNSSPTPPATNHPRGHPREFEPIITAKSHNFIGREFVFTAIHDFIHRYHRGYFTIIGAPGSGKSAILAKYALDNPDVVYYNVELAGKNRADEFLRNICTQLLETLQETSVNHLPDNATDGSWFLSLLLQQISEQLQDNQKLIIAIDGLNFIDRNLQPPGANLFYLPRYLPDGVYFLLTRRPFVREKSGLLIEAPSQSLDLADYPAENRRDVEGYIRENLTPLTPLPYEGRGGHETGRGGQENYSPLLAGEGLGEGSSEQEFCTHLTTESENNFMYLSQILQAIADGFYSEPFQYNQIPPGLETYYQQHLQAMIPPAQHSEFTSAVLRQLVKQPTPILAAAIAEILDTDEFEVEEVLEHWTEFLQQERNAEATDYSLYHSHFRDWLIKQQSIE